MVGSTAIINGCDGLRSRARVVVFFVVARFVSAITFFSFSIAVPVVVVVVHTGVIEISVGEVPVWYILSIPGGEGVVAKRGGVSLVANL